MSVQATARRLTYVVALALTMATGATAETPRAGASGSPFAGVWYTRGQVVGSKLVIRSDGSWETQESRGRWTANGRRIEMDGNARGWCDGKGEIDDAGKVLTFACDRSWGRMTTIFDKWEEEPGSGPEKPPPTRNDAQPDEPKTTLPERGVEPGTGSSARGGRARVEEARRQRAGRVRRTRADDVQPVESTSITEDRAQEVKPVRGSDIEPFRADEVKRAPPADAVTSRPAGSGSCAAAPQRGARFVGTLREPQYGTYKYVLELDDLPQSGAISGRVTIVVSESRVLDGELTGTVRGGRFAIAGELRQSWNRWQHRVEGTIADGALRAAVRTKINGAAEWVPGELALAQQRGLDPATVGTWAMVVPGAAYSQELDRGSYLERVNRASAGAAAGVLQVAADGRYTWKKRAGTQSGRVTYCETSAGRSGWSVAYDGEPFFLGYLDGENGGFYLFSTRTGDYVYRGQPIR